MFDTDYIKNFLTGLIVRWVLKIGCGFLLSVGIQSGTVTEIVGAIVAIVVGLAISLFQQKKAVNTTPIKTL
jgi:hypothetical protein